MHISIVNSLEITKPKINFTHFFGERIDHQYRDLNEFSVSQLSYLIFEVFYFYTYCMCACMCAYICSCACGSQKMALGHMELELRL